MIIENAQYVLTDGTTQNSSINCTIDGVTMAIPMDTANRHYAEILKQVEAGTLTIKDAE
tara:strand:+ start:361 stop:537 length:177 start_codon:yes stop_codon:yes gene_type:complete